MKAVLLLDPDRRDDQLAFVKDRATILRSVGDQLWVSLPDEKADLFVQQGIHVQPQESADLILVPAVVFDPQEAVPTPPAQLTATPPDGDNTAYYIVQFTAAPEGDWIRQVQYAGGILIEPLPVHAAIYRLTLSQAEAVSALADSVRWAGLYHPAYAMNFEVAGRDEPFSAADLAGIAPAADKVAPQPEGSLTVAFFVDRNPDDMAPLIQATGAQLVDRRGAALIINASAEQIPAVLRVDGVRSLEVYRPPDLSNQRAGTIMGANQVRNFGNVDFLVNLDGTGEIVGVFDTGLDNGAVPTTHIDFNVVGGAASRVIAVNNLNTAPVTAQDFNGHGTHVCGSIVGNSQSAPLPNAANPNRSVPRGIAPAAQLVLTSVNNFNAPPPPGLPLNFNQFITAFQNHYNSGARVHSNSWGSKGPNAYTNATSGVIDRFAFLNPDSVVLFAAGNDEADLNNDGNFDQNFLGDESTPKNILTIGASENVTSLDGDGRNYQTRTAPCNRYGTLAAGAVTIAANVATAFSCSDNANDIAMFSSRGQVRNLVRAGHRRVKPDLVAPGTNILSTRSSAMPIAATIGQSCPPIANPPGIPNPRLANTAPQAQYFIISGTSMATPLSSGACLLVRQFYRSRFAQLRRPLLLEQETAFVDLPCAASNSNGPLLAWIHQDAGAGQNHLVAAQYAADLSRTTNIVQIAANVGAHPAPAAIGLGANTCFLYRDSGSVLHLTMRDAALAPIAAFGTAGTVNLAPVSRAEDDRRPALAVNNNEIAVVWVQTGTDNLLFQRFRVDTGAAIDANAVTIGAATQTSPHPYVLHNGTQWAAFWESTVAAKFQLMLRFIDNSGNPVGAQATTVLTQAQDLREPHAVWDARQNKYMVAFVSAAAAPNRGIVTCRLNADGSLFGVATTSVPLATANSRRPRLCVHPDSGFVLLWEDNSQNASFDVYFALLDAAGVGPATPTRISDTPIDSSGFSAICDSAGFVPVWQSSNEIHSNVLGVYTLRVLKSGLFQAQADPSTPLIVNQTYQPEILTEHARPTLTATAVAWGGGEFFLARLVPDGIIGDALELVRTDADGRPISVGGTLRIAGFLSLNAVALSWRGSRVLVGVSWLTGIELHLLDLQGRSVAAFGPGGKVSISPIAPQDISLQIAQSGTGAASRYFAVFGATGAPLHKIRYTVRNSTGGTTGPGAVAPLDLVSASGTATHGWFHLVLTDVPPRFIAAWHVLSGAVTVAQLNKFLLNGTPQGGLVAAPIPLTALPGDAQNPVIAPRPVTFAPQMPPTPADIANQNRREFGAAWQQRPPAGRWQVLFSRLQQNGTPSATAGQFDVVAVQSATDHMTQPQLVWHTDGYGLAWLKQPVAGGNQQLFFTILDQNGIRPNLAAAGAPASPATDFAVSAASADVKTFHLIWTGRSFRIAWTEVEGGNLRHKLMALAVPRVAGGVRYDVPFQQPTSALIRATLINGATNIRNTPLPNFGNNVNDGYGWGRVNLRQSLSPAPPVTFFVRDDGVVGQGRIVTYNFPLPPNTQFLRITLAWTDLPDNDIVNHLHLRVTTPAFNPGGVRVFHGNRWQTAAGSTHLSAPVVAPIPAFEDTHTVQQVVLSGPPALPAGNYTVEVIASSFGASPFQQFPGQPFALVFVGSGPEIRTAAAAPAGPSAFY